ncbi:MAG: helix-turn-helix DNA-binding protein, partial [Caulobacteraceae bacterium]|nr:helix-turn-helix DNA-binding protein [Caulobacteraceae bacterium]
MPLDTAAVAADLFAGPPLKDSPPVASASSVEALVLSYGAHLGEGLRAAREARRLSIQDVSDVTRVHTRFLEALEALDMGQLPSRPFAIGFVRAYARFLAVDEERAIARFKADAPDANEPFRAPVGVTDDGDPRLALIAVGTALVLGAIIVWNVAQRAMADKDPVPAAAVVQAPPPVAAIPSGPVALGDALPAPVESTIPRPYVTPGLGHATNALTGDPTLAQTAQETLSQMPVSNPNAAVFGAAAD